MTGRIWARLLALFKKSALDREFDDEAQSHITLATDDYLQRGMSLPEARRLARLKFGSIAASKDAHRASRGVAWLEGFLSYWSFDFMTQAIRLWIRQATRQTALTVFLFCLWPFRWLAALSPCLSTAQYCGAVSLSKTQVTWSL